MNKHTDRQVSKFILLFSLIIALMMPAGYCSADEGFTLWLKELRIEAIERGISEATLDSALSGLEPIKRVIELDRNQPEFKRSFESYLDMMVSRSRVIKGRRMLDEHREMLEEVKKRYGVQPRFLVAIWGLETNFGKHTGGFKVVPAVATLAYDDRRKDFFRRELFHVLKILDEGHIDISEMSGSWAGAMGQLQFMPSTFISFAVDADGDGRKDIWHSLPDVFFSAANFLSSYGWKEDYIWGREVVVPDNLDPALFGMKNKKSLAEWQSAGVRRADGRDLPEDDIEASLIRPSKRGGPAFLVYKNYRAIMRWNRSHLYALAVCYLSDRIAGGVSLK